MRGGFCSLLAVTASALSTSSVPRPSSIKLFYGDMPFWRAEVVRLALFTGGVPFEDVRVSFGSDEVKAMRAAGKLTFGAVPVMEVDGKILSQTQAMAVYAAKVAGLHPEDAWDAAKVDECINGCTDVTGTVGATFRLPPEEKVPAREKLIAPDGRLTMHLGGLEQICAENGACGHAVGSSLTVADLAIWIILFVSLGGTACLLPPVWRPRVAWVALGMCVGATACPPLAISPRRPLRPSADRPLIYWPSLESWSPISPIANAIL